MCRIDLLIWCPVIGRLPQIAQIRDMYRYPLFFFLNLSVNNTTIRRKMQISFFLIADRDSQIVGGISESQPLLTVDDWKYLSCPSSTPVNPDSDNPYSRKPTADH